MQQHIKNWFVLFFIVLPGIVFSQNDAAKKAEKKKMDLEREQEEAKEQDRQAKLQHQYDMQSESVKKRMKKNQQVTDRQYKRQLHKTWWQQMFSFKRKEKVNSHLNAKNKKPGKIFFLKKRKSKR